MLQIHIKPSNNKISFTFENTISITELYDELLYQYKLQHNVEEWICYSETRQKKLKNDENLERNINEKLIIFTYQSKSQISNIQEITLFLNIEYDSGKKKKQIMRQFQTTANFKDVNELALAECDLLYDKNCQIEIKIFGQTYTQSIINSKKIEQMIFRNNATIDIKLTCNNFDEERDILMQLQKKGNQIQKQIQQYFDNIKLKVEIILMNTLDSLNQFLSKIKTGIAFTEKNINYQDVLNKIEVIDGQLDNIVNFIENLKILTNQYTERIIEDSSQLLNRYINRAQVLTVPYDATIIQVINYSQLPNINYQSQLRFSNKLINQLDLNEQMRNLDNHTIYIDTLRINIKQLDNNRSMKEVQIFY